ncbi:hypothetical protein Tco_0578743 [Tanacetum coccineum]
MAYTCSVQSAGTRQIELAISNLMSPELHYMIKLCTAANVEPSWLIAVMKSQTPSLLVILAMRKARWQNLQPSFALSALDCDVVGVGVAPFIWGIEEMPTWCNNVGFFLDKEDEITKPYSDNFRPIFDQLESLYERGCRECQLNVNVGVRRMEKIAVKSACNASNIGYGFLPISFSSLEELDRDAVTLMKRIRKFFVTQDIGARAAIHIFKRISFAMAKGVELN